MAERVGRRFSNFHVAGRDQVNLQRDEGPRPEKKGGTAGLLEPFVQSRARPKRTRRATAATARPSARSLESIESMAPVRGRKSVIVDVSRLHHGPGVRPVQGGGGRRRRANIAMYFVDVRGLEAQSVFGSAQFGLAARYPRRGRRERGSVRSRRKGPSSLADSSGGFSVQNKNDLGGRPSPHRPRVPRLLPAWLRARRPRPMASSGASACAWTGRTSRFAPGRGTTPAAYRRIPVRARETDALEVALESPYDHHLRCPSAPSAYVFGNANEKDASVLLAVEADLRAFALKSSDAECRVTCSI